MVVLREVANDVLRDHRHVARRAAVTDLGDARDVLERGVLQAPGLGLAIHHRHVGVDAAGHAFGERHRGVIAGVDDQPLQQFVDRGRHRGIDEHQRSAALALGPGALGHRQLLVQRQLVLAQRDEDRVRRHQLGERSRVCRRVGTALGQHLSRVHVDQQEFAGGDLGWRQGLAEGSEAGGRQTQEGEKFFHGNADITRQNCAGPATSAASAGHGRNALRRARRRRAAPAGAPSPSWPTGERRRRPRRGSTRCPRRRAAP